MVGKYLMVAGVVAVSLVAIQVIGKEHVHKASLIHRKPRISKKHIPKRGSPNCALVDLVGKLRWCCGVPLNYNLHLPTFQPVADYIEHLPAYAVVL